MQIFQSFFYKFFKKTKKQEGAPSCFNLRSELFPQISPLSTAGACIGCGILNIAAYFYEDLRSCYNFLYNNHTLQSCGLYIPIFHNSYT